MANIKDKNEPGRFLGEGVSFRAKLIGVLEVPEARGDRMCQEALADLKMAIRAAGEHKQRIQVHVAIDGLRLRDDKTGDSLYHHPVHKISFIAQDMTDSRAFGYIFGSPDTGHRFFGIKTDKAASQVVIAMRDLFQVVFELKKKEVEMAKQQLEGKTVTSSLVRQAAAAADIKVKNITSAGSEAPVAKGESHAEGGVAELVDLEQELSSLRRGLSQVEGLTPSSDPFGDSFIVPSSQKGLLPPPPSGSSSRGRNTPASARSVFSPTKAQPLPFDLATGTSDFEPTTSLVDNFNEPTVGRRACAAAALSYDVFTELDPLGTGRSKPYVDKKLFFQELKNPPKKVLKDLVPSQSLLSETSAPDAKGDQYGSSTTMTSLSRQSGGTVAIVKPAQGMFSGNFFSSDPFAETDPFDNTDPFSDSFKDDPFTSMQEFPKIIRGEDLKIKLREVTQEKEPEREVKSVFNGPLQVSLPPEPAPKSPRLQRQGGDMSSVRQRPGRIRRGSVSPPPLPPKAEVPGRPPPRPPHDHDDLDQDNEPGPPLPRPARKREPQADRSRKPRLSSGATNSSEEEYLTPVPPPLPLARRFDITLAQLLTCTMDDLAERIQVPPATLASMTLPQLTEYLRLYLAADIDRAHVHVVPRPEKDKPSAPAPTIEKPPPIAPPIPTDFKPQFEDNFAPPGEAIDAFVANFDDFDKKANPSYDRYAAFREIQELELKSKSILDPLDALETEPKQDSDEKEELTAIDNLMRANQEADTKDNKSPLKSLDELTLDSFNMFRNSVSPKPSQIDAKIEDIKTVMKTLQIEKARRSVSPRDNGSVDVKLEDNCDRYAALREITITEPSQDEFESLPPEVPKERKKSDEKSDGFDNSDFFDCIDNSSLSFTHVEDAFRKSPVVKERVEPKVEVVKEKEIAVELTPVRELQPPPARLSTGSISDVVSGSSPDTKDKCVRGGVGVGVGVGVGSARWAVLGGAPSGGSSDSRDSDPRPRRRPHRHHSPNHRANIVQTSSSSRDVSPWDDDLPPVTRLQRPAAHHRDRESRHNSSGSRERLDSGSGREKEKLRDKRDLRDRDRDMSRDGRDSRERDSGSGRDRRDSKEREHRRRRSRDRENDSWDRDRTYSRDRDRDYRDSRSRERPPKDYREKDRDRHRKPRHSYDDEEDYSDGCGSGRSSPRDRWSEQRWRRDERNYGSLGWRETRRRAELRQTDDPGDRRFGCTLGWPGRRAAAASRRDTERDSGRGEGRESGRDTRDSGREGRDSGREGRDSGREGRDSGREGRDSGREGRDSGREARDSGRESRDSGRESRDSRDAPRRRTRRDEPRRPRDYRFCGDYPEREGSPFEAPFPEPAPATKKRPSYTSLEHTRFTFEGSESAASPVSGSSVRARDGDSPATRFRFSSDSVSPRSLFEDDFTPRTRTASIAEEDESLPPLPTRPQHSNRDIKKSESVNIFTRECDPFEGDAFFAITGSDRAARRDNWPPHCRGFDT